MKALFALLSLSLTVTAANARQLSASEAYAMGSAMVPASQTSSMLSINAAAEASEPVITMSEDGENTLYAFNRAEGGYMVVAADDAAPVAVIGWADKGSLPSQEDMPHNLKWWLESCSHTVAAASKGAINNMSLRRSIPASARASVSPLLSTVWGQLAPFNGNTPEVNGKNTPAGCVAVAMAQVMNYYGYPTTGTGTKTYTSQGVRHSVNFAEVTFEWSKMKNNFANSADAEANAAVASLLYTLGVSCKTTYTASASSASINNAAIALVNNFGYDSNVRILNRDYFTLEGWMSVIYNELNAGRPVLYTGQNPEIGHAFVADGYYATAEAEYLHINWGWDGYSNGYFAMMEMNPTNQGVGGSTSGYNNGQVIVVGIQPAREDGFAQPVAEFTNDFSLTNNGSSVRVADVNGIFMNNISKATASFGVRLTNAEGRELYIAESRTRNLIRGAAVMYYDMDASLFPTEGTWTVAPAIKDEAGQWITDGLVKMSKVRTSTLEASAEGLTFINHTSTDAHASELVLLSPVFSGKTFGLGAILTTDDDEYFQSVTPALYKDGVRVATGPSINVHLYSGESKYVEWVGKFTSTFAPGEYTIALVETDGTVISDAIAVSVEATPDGNAEVLMAVDMGNGISSAYAQNSQMRPEEVSIDPLMITVHIECTSGYFAENIAGVIFQGTQGIVKLPEQFVGVKAGESVAITFEYEGTELQHGVTYNIKTLASNSQMYIGQPTYFRSSLAANEEVSIDSASATDYVQFFNLNGVEVSNPTTPGIYVAIAADGTSHKIAIR